MISRDAGAPPALLDLNALFALAWPTHVHHQRAQTWFGEVGPLGWATCPTTESGFVRLSANPKVTGVPRTAQQAIELLRTMIELPGHAFWEDDVAMSRPHPLDPHRIRGYRQITAVHLLALAIRRGGRLATFDRGVKELAGDHGEAVTLIP